MHFCFLSSADVSITLRNRGRDPYKPEVYGQSITVDLRITREGLRTYKLRSKSGNISIRFQPKYLKEHLVDTSVWKELKHCKRLKISHELRNHTLFNPLGQIISSKKEELMCILDNFNIQVFKCPVFHEHFCFVVLVQTNHSFFFFL